jgi:16S rRNA pseudouridine516 synthase
MDKPCHSRLDSLISRYAGVSKRQVREWLIHKRIKVDGVDASAMNQRITPFTQVMLDEEWVQHFTPVYLMLNKPQGVVSATVDKKHQTVLDIIDHPNKHQLHIAGRLDFNTTGLLLLTNDSQWSKQLSLPENNIQKTYQVTLSHPVTEEYASVFSKGIYFAYENITTRPATIVVIDDHTVELSICEGRYHQVKRMFGYFQNTVLSLQRVSIGGVLLDHNLSLGEHRVMTAQEINDLRVV